MNIDQYLQRIDYHGPRKATSDVLEALHVAHLRTVPFENLSIHRQEDILLSEAHLFDKIVVGRRGGFCYELNGLFAVLLRELGFDVQLLSARVYQKDGTYSPDFDHLALLINLEGPYLADVGFGESFLQPLRLQNGVLQMQSGKTFVLKRSEAIWTLSERTGSDGFKAVYCFTLRPYDLSDFTARCQYHQHSAESHFTQKTICTRATLEGRITLSGDRFIVTQNGERFERSVSKHEHAELLERHFGFVLGAQSPGGVQGHER